MRVPIRTGNIWIVILLIIAVAVLTACATTGGSEQSPPKDPQSLNIKPGPKKVVSIYQFRSKVSNLSNSAATDMFTTALVKTRAFSVVERQRLAKGVKSEKKLQNKDAVGTAGKSKLMGVNYIFEGTVSEFTPGEEEGEYGMSLAGMEASRDQSVCGIGIDVRIIDAENGQVIDSVNARRSIGKGSNGISGVGNLLRRVSGTGSSLDPDVKVKKSSKGSIERTLRVCIEDAVNELVKRYAAD